MTAAVLSMMSAAASTASAATLYANDFSSSTLGAQPSGFNQVTPASNSGAGDNPPVAGSPGPIGAIVVNGSSSPVANTAGSGNGLRIYDHHSGSSDAVGLRTTSFTSTPVLTYSLNFSTDAFSANSGSAYLRIGLGNGAFSPTSGSATLARAEIVRTGAAQITVAATNGGSGAATVADLNASTTPAVTLGSANELVIYLNQSGASTSYQVCSLTRSLGNRSYDIWVNGSLLNSTNLLMNTSTGALVNGLGFATGGGQTGADFVVDNLLVTDALPPVPEPSALAAGAVLGALALRRRSRSL